MLHFPNCKINLGLHITGKRPDGYHDLESVFYPLPLRDALEMVVAETNSFATYGAPIPGDSSDNLVLKAYDVLKQNFPDILPVKIALLKNIPMGAGLGGGSANGAEALKMLNELFKLNLDDEVLAGYALKLGSDCPFFIKNCPALATGRGEILKPIDLDLSGYQFVIVKPPVHLSTAWAFSQICPQIAHSGLLQILAQPVDTWKNLLSNDFEPAVFKAYPQVGAIKNSLYQAGALYSSMSGSGSAVYAIFDQDVPVVNLKNELAGCEIFTC
ncbi:MAG: 4-(cytidine 5'-diphospho)-2-C-methyl-D-erythritol kinase [Chitinophagaceae bacterium]|nr:4-(cytidine 5'-diphospho)-2-C-methyl-D-erythritol kinase [Chitinophagaceae bacterium]